MAAAALRRHGAVEEVERVGDHARGEDVVDGERAAAEVDGVGVHVPVVADGGGDRRHLLGRRAVHVHVAPGDEGELGRREQAPRHHELVGGTGPRRGRLPLGVDAGRAGGHDRRVALAGGDGGGCLEHPGDAVAAGAAPGRPAPQLVDPVRGVAGPADRHAVDLVRRQAGLGQHPSDRLEDDRLRRLALEDRGPAGCCRSRRWRRRGAGCGACPHTIGALGPASRTGAAARRSPRGLRSRSTGG